MNGLSQAGVLINRKMLSELAIQDSKAFDQLVKMAEEKTTAQASA